MKANRNIFILGRDGDTIYWHGPGWYHRQLDDTDSNRYELSDSPEPWEEHDTRFWDQYTLLVHLDACAIVDAIIATIQEHYSYVPPLKAKETMRGAFEKLAIVRSF